MRIHKFLSAVVAMLLFGALLAACGGTTPAAAPTAAPAPTAAAEAPAATAAPAPTAAAEATTAPAPTAAAAAPTAAAEATTAPAPTAAAAAPTAAAAASGTADKVTLQLKWVTQAQFAGYYAALDQGFYKAENLDVTLRPGGPDVVPEQVVA